MYIEERHKVILETINKNGRISNKDIQETFGISYDSAKRDLRIMEVKGLLKRTHGGAIPVPQAAASRPPEMTCKDIECVKDNYLNIAQKAVSMIKDRDVIFIICASVGFFMAKSIPEDLKIRVVTNSIIIAEELRVKKNIDVIMLGGEMDHKGNCYDAFATEMISRLHFDKCFITSACISKDFGLSIQRTQAMPFYRTLIENSDEVIGLFPTEKIGLKSIVSICKCSKLDTIIVDDMINCEDLDAFREEDINIVLVEQRKDCIDNGI